MTHREKRVDAQSNNVDIIKVRNTRKLTPTQL
jgi:hypothetical protein